MLNTKQNIILNEILRDIPERSQFSFGRVINNFNPYSLNLRKSLLIDLDLYKRVGLTDNIIEFLFEKGFVEEYKGGYWKLSEKGRQLKKSGSFKAILRREAVSRFLKSHIHWIVDLLSLILLLLTYFKTR